MSNPQTSLNKQKNKYKIILEPSSIFVLSSLFLLSAALVFYLGISFGKAERIISSNSLLTDLTAKAQKAAQELSLLKINNSNKTVDDYQNKIAAIDKGLEIPDSLTDKKNNSQKQANNGSKATAVKEDNKFTIQVAVMTNGESASRLLKKLREDNLDAYIIALPDDQGQLLYRVRVGSGLNKEQLNEQLKQLTSRFAGLAVPSVHEYGVLD